MNHINNYVLKQNKYILKNQLLFWKKDMVGSSLQIKYY